MNGLSFGRELKNQVIKQTTRAVESDLLILRFVWHSIPLMNLNYFYHENYTSTFKYIYGQFLYHFSSSLPLTEREENIGKSCYSHHTAVHTDSHKLRSLPYK